MNTATKTIVTHSLHNIIRQKTFYFLLGLFYVLLVYASITGNNYLKKQNSMQLHYQQQFRKSWEDNPDKHPHRMAHFGSVALRIKHPMSVFDFGLDNYSGNAVYLEAHKQNTVNFSEASFSTGILRMGELSIAMLLQLILPLIIFFCGFGSIAADRENGTLKVLMSQGISNFQLIKGRTIGLWLVSSLFYIPAFAATGILLASQKTTISNAAVLPRFTLTVLLYSLFCWVVSAITIMVSAKSRNTKNALINLLGIWLLLAVILPKVVQAVSNMVYPSPSKLKFETAIEKDILRQGDSHNPDDPFFKSVRDSVFKRYGVTTTDSLPVNMGGIVGREGERLSAETYMLHYNKLTRLYKKQNEISKTMGFLDPFMMIKHNSMALAGSDFENYIHFQQQAEAYRYQLAQQMNDLQIKYISNKKPKEGNHGMHVDNAHFKAFPDFTSQFISLQETVNQEYLPLAALLFWLLLSWAGLIYVSRTFKILSA